MILLILKYLFFIILRLKTKLEVDMDICFELHRQLNPS